MNLLAPILLTLAFPQAPQAPRSDGFPDEARRAAAAAERALARSTERPKQTPDAPPVELSSVVERAVAVNSRSDGSIVASGRGWLGRWVEDRFSFSVFGASPERDDPTLELRLEQVGRSEGPALASKTDAPELERATAGTLARVHRSASDGVQERWDVRRDGVELSFVLAEKPAGKGDLVARLQIDTDLRAPHGLWTEGLDFTDADGAGIRVGGVTAIGAAGRTARGWLEWDGQRLCLGVPGEFVDTCAYPLVVDPVITGVLRIFGTSSKDEDPVVTWDEASATWAVAWARPVPGKSYSWMVLVQRLYSWGGLRGAADVLESSAYSGWDVFTGYHFVRIVPVTGPNLFVVSAGSATRYGGPGSVIHWFPVDPVSGFLGASRSDSFTMAGQITGLDLGTDPLSSYPNFLTVWREQGVGVFSALSTVDAADRVRGRDYGMELVTTDAYGLTTDSSIAVSSSAGAPGYWFVSWSSSVPQNRLRGRVISYYGSLVTPVTDLEAAAFGTSFVRLSVAGDGHEYFVCYSRNNSTQRLQYRRCHFLGGTTTVDAPVTLDSFPLPTIASNAGAIARPKIQRVGDKYIAAWLRRTGTGNWTMRSASVSAWWSPIHGTPVVMTSFGPEVRNLWLGTQSDSQAYPASSDEGMLVTEGSTGILRMFVRH